MQKDVMTNCSGCSACINKCPVNAISMLQNNEGFLYPQIDESKCIKCGLCEKVCHLINKVEKYDALPKALALEGDDNIRAKSSSGGIFTLLAEKILDNNGFVCGASYSEDFKKVKHIIISKKEDLDKLRTSKYLQSDIGNIFKEIETYLKNNQEVLFSGTACQCAGLRNFLGKDYENLLLVDILCHGVPSPLVWGKYLDEISNGRKIKNVNFRNKNNGWKSPSLLRIDFEDGSYYEGNSNNDLYYRAFLENISLRKSCTSCLYTTSQRVSDITLGDFWRFNKYYKKYDNKGTSLVLPNTPKGSNYIEKIQKELKLSKVFPIRFAIKGNPILKKPAKEHKNRDVFFVNLEKSKITSLIEHCLSKKYDGIIYNLWYSHANYGAILTSYAIQQYFRRKGLDYRILNFNPERKKKRYAKSFTKTFAEKHLILTDEIKSKKELKKLNALTDTFVVGSDQVFRDFHIRRNSDLSMLTYTDFDKKRVAFSASFGVGENRANELQIPHIKRFLKRFDAISVREDSGVDICKETFNVNAEHIIDPVFLVDKTCFTDLCDEKFTKYKDKLIYYILDVTEDNKKYIDKMAQELNTEAINITEGNISVEEFLTAILTCKYFITDSFHGTCFALIFHKNFICIKNEERGNARFDSLTNTFNISNCFVNGLTNMTSSNLASLNYDKDFYDKKVLEEQQKSETWFNKIFYSEKFNTPEQIENEKEFLKFSSKLKKLPSKKKSFAQKMFSIEKPGKQTIMYFLGIKIRINK